LEEAAGESEEEEIEEGEITEAAVIRRPIGFGTHDSGDRVQFVYV